MSWFVYILRCADGTLYTGTATDVKRRLAEHNEKRGAKYTRTRVPAQLVYEERCSDRGSALRREIAVKRMTRAQKETLICACGSRACSTLPEQAGKEKRTTETE